MIKQRLFLMATVAIFSIFSFLNLGNFKNFFNFANESQTNSIYHLNEQNNQNSNDGNSKNENTKIASGDTTSYVSVGELFNSSKKKFNKDTLQTLFNYIGGANNTQYKTIETLSKGQTPDEMPGHSALQIRQKTYGKTNSQDIVITLGGFKWQVEYLSTDTEGNAILTLWYTGEQQIYSKWSMYAYNNYRVNYPSNMYGTSYMNAVTLNNGGYYATGTNSLTYASQSSSSVFANFTMSNYGLTNYLVKPNKVPWQVGQTVRYKFIQQDTYYVNHYKNNGTPYRYEDPNNSAGPFSFKYDTDYTYSGNGGVKDILNNSTTMVYYYAWANSYLWIPSVIETGFGETGCNEDGIWQTSLKQRCFYAYHWLRSGNLNYAGQCDQLCADGWFGSARLGVTDSYAVRPAMHLNLTEAYNSAFDLWNSTTQKFNADNLTDLLKVTANNSTLSGLTNLLSETEVQISNASNGGKLNASAIKKHTNNLINKNGYIIRDGELIVRFGGLDWYAVYLIKDNATPTPNIILTLFLDDSEQLYNSGKIGTDGSVKYNVYGSASWNGGAPPYDNASQSLGTGQFSNNYGNSNIRTSLFSNESTTTSPASVFYNYLKTSSNKSAMGDFIVAPKDIKTQDTLNLQKNQSAKSTLGFRYNLPNESYANLDKLNPKYSINGVVQSDSEASLSTPIMLPATGTADTQTTLIINEKLASTNSALLNYTAWQNDKLWLPSLSEVGLGSNNAITSLTDESNPTDTSLTTKNNSRTGGLWGLSTIQRSNTNKTATWLRSGHITDNNLAYTISADGTDYGHMSINAQNGIRPALHLNLTLACNNAV